MRLVGGHFPPTGKLPGSCRWRDAMRTSKLLMIGLVLLGFGLAPTVQAEDSAGPETPAAETGEIAPEGSASDETAAPTPVESAEVAPAAEAPLAERVPAVSPDPDAVAEAAAHEIAPAVAQIGIELYRPAIARHRLFQRARIAPGITPRITPGITSGASIKK